MKKKPTNIVKVRFALIDAAPLLDFYAVLMVNTVLQVKRIARKFKMLKKMIAMATQTVKNDCDGPICMDGMCCPNAGWVCCNSPTGLDICLPEEDLWNCD